MRCGRCGNENDDTNRFCGMCGAALVAGNQAAGQAVGLGAGAGSGTSGSGATGVERSRRFLGRRLGPMLWPSTRPVISGGPSLLGLNLPASETGSGVEMAGTIRCGRLLMWTIFSRMRKNRGAAGASGFWWWWRWRWRWDSATCTGKAAGFDWLNAGDKKPTAVTAQTPDSGQSGSGFRSDGGRCGSAGWRERRRDWSSCGKSRRQARRVRGNPARRKRLLRRLLRNPLLQSGCLRRTPLRRRALPHRPLLHRASTSQS